MKDIWITVTIGSNYLTFRNVNKDFLFRFSFGAILVAMFYIVLAKIPTEDGKQIMGVYLYRNQKQNSSYFFQLDEYDR